MIEDAVLPSNFKLQTIRCLATQIIVQVAVELTTWAYVRRQGKSYTEYGHWDSKAENSLGPE